MREHSGSVIECLSRDGRVPGSSLTSIAVLWSLSKTHLSYLSTGSTQEDPSLFHWDLLMGRKESNQINNLHYKFRIYNPLILKIVRYLKLYYILVLFAICARKSLEWVYFFRKVNNLLHIKSMLKQTTLLISKLQIFSYPLV